MSYETQAIQTRLAQLKQESTELQARLDKLESCKEVDIGNEATKIALRVGVGIFLTTLGIPYM